MAQCSTLKTHGHDSSLAAASVRQPSCTVQALSADYTLCCAVHWCGMYIAHVAHATHACIMQHSNNDWNYHTSLPSLHQDNSSCGDGVRISNNSVMFVICEKQKKEEKDVSSPSCPEGRCSWRSAGRPCLGRALWAQCQRQRVPCWPLPHPTHATSLPSLWSPCMQPSIVTLHEPIYIS
jgi:hypothetical protein